MVREEETLERPTISIYERLVSGIPVPCQVPWLVLAAMLFFAFVLLVKITSGSTSYVFMAIFPSFMIAYAPIATIWASQQLYEFGDALKYIVNQPQSESTLWYRSQLKVMFSSRRAAFFGVVYGVPFVVCIGIATKWWRFPFPWFDSVASDLFLTFMLSLAALMIGAGLYLMLCTALFAFRLSNQDLQIPIYQHPLTSVKAVGRLHLKFSLIVAVADAAFILAFLLSPLALTPLIASWLIGISLAIILYFLAPLVRIHNKMSEAKHTKIRQFASSLEESFREVTANPTSASIQQLESLLEIQRHLQDMSEWPFDAGAVAALLSATIIPIVAVVLDAADIAERIF